MQFTAGGQMSDVSSRIGVQAIATCVDTTKDGEGVPRAHLVMNTEPIICF